MPTWNADQYLKFTEERTRPCHDLVGAIRASNVGKIIDLGCGPGNSTEVLARRWPEAGCWPAACSSPSTPPCWCVSRICSGR